MTSSFSPSFLSFTLPSGNVSQAFAPFFTQQVALTYQGSPAIEQRVVSEVASFGRQLGRILDAVRLLSEGRTEEPFVQLIAMADEIDRVKARSRESALREARASLDLLAKADRDELGRLLRTYRPPES